MTDAPSAAKRRAIALPMPRDAPVTSAVFPPSPLSMGAKLPRLPKRLLIHHVRHLRDVPPVILLQHINQPLHAAPSHPLIRIRREPRNPPRAGKMRIKPAPILN